MEKVMMVDEMEYDEELKCHHVFKTQCMENVVTKFENEMVRTWTRSDSQL